MSPAVTLRALTPLGWLAGGAATLVAALLVLGGLGFRWDPLDLARRRADRAEASAALATAAAAARSAEAEGQAGLVARLDAILTTGRRIDAATTRSILEARNADDSDLSLAPDRVDRLRAHDRELCRLAPDLGGCTPATYPSGDGGAAL